MFKTARVFFCACQKSQRCIEFVRVMYNMLFVSFFGDTVYSGELFGVLVCLF